MEVIQATSDEAKGLCRHVKTDLGAHHAPDVFHVQHDTGLALAQWVKQAEQALAEAQAQLHHQSPAQMAYREQPRRPPGRPPAFEQRIDQARNDRAVAEANFAQAQAQRTQAKELLHELSAAYPPYDLDSGQAQPPERVVQRLRACWDPLTQRLTRRTCPSAAANSSLLAGRPARKRPRPPKPPYLQPLAARAAAAETMTMASVFIVPALIGGGSRSFKTAKAKEQQLMQSNQGIKEYFDRHAERYDEIVRAVEFQLNDGYRYLADYLRLASTSQDELHTLELGIGTGKLTKYVLEGDLRVYVTGVDTSSKMLEKAESNLGQCRDRLELVCGDFSAGVIPERKYDFVISAIALTFYTIDHEYLFRRVHHLLKKDGLFVYAANVAQNVSVVDRMVGRMLVAQLSIGEEQAQWLRDIKGGPDTDIFMAPVQWHVQQLRRAGFSDADCIYLRYKLGIFSGLKPGSAV